MADRENNKSFKNKEYTCKISIITCFTNMLLFHSDRLLMAQKLLSSKVSPDDKSKIKYDFLKG